MQASVRTTVAMALVALTVSSAHGAGVVRTLEGRLEGHVVFRDGRIEVDGKPVPWPALVYAMPDGHVRTLGAPGAVRLAGGEVWRGDVLSLSAAKLTIRSRLWGERRIDAARVTAVEFAHGAPAPDASKPGTLYREDGEPIPGSLLWIGPSRLAIDSPLGVLTLARKGLIGYVFDRTAAGRTDARAADEVGLVDGTVLRGRAKPAAGAVQLQHPALGTLTLNAGMIRYLRRHNGHTVDLAEIWTRSGQAGEPTQGRPVEVVFNGEAQRHGATCLAAVRIRPKSLVRYRLPQAAGTTVTLTGRLGPVEAARGDVRIRIAAGNRVLLEKEFAPGAGHIPLRVDVPTGGELVFDVGFGKRIGFPAGIRIEDPLLISR
jgi:hypothetical protein